MPGEAGGESGKSASAIAIAIMHIKKVESSTKIQKFRVAFDVISSKLKGESDEKSSECLLI